ncbi:14688_t:CDS:2, partial [Racocetra persica]
MGGKVQSKPKSKPKESKNSPSTKSMPLSSGIFTQNLVHILENSQEYQEIAVIASRGEDMKKISIMSKLTEADIRMEIDEELK